MSTESETQGHAGKEPRFCELGEDEDVTNINTQGWTNLHKIKEEPRKKDICNKERQ